MLETTVWGKGVIFGYYVMVSDFGRHVMNLKMATPQAISAWLRNFENTL